MEEHFCKRSIYTFHSLLPLLTFFAVLLLSSAIEANDKTMITLKDLTEAITERSCSCIRSVESLKKSDEHLRLLLKISSVRIVSTLQNLADHVNAEITYFIESTRWKVYDEMMKHFPRLLSQPSVADSIDTFVDSIRKKLFITADISPQRIEKEVEKAVQKFFVQLIPTIFLCITTGPCKSVSQTYANCLHSNSPSWGAFYGTEPNKLGATLRQAILKYRLIESTIDKLHRSAMEIEEISDSCVTRYSLLTSCAPFCYQNEKTSDDEATAYCSDDCKNAVRACLHESTSDWDAFISVLFKLSSGFDKGFVELEKGIIRSVSYAIEMHAPAITKMVLRKCGRISFLKTAENFRHQTEYQKPDPVRKRTAFMIQQFTSYIGWWRQLVSNVCSVTSRTFKCWNGTAVVGNSAEISSGQPSVAKSIGSGVAVAIDKDHVEGSGNNNNMVGWSDDEDLGGEGSGAQDEGSGDTEGVLDQYKSPAVVVQTTTTENNRDFQAVVPVTTTAYEEPKLTSNPPTKPPVIAKPPTTGSADRSALSVLAAFITLLWAPLLFC